MARLTGHCLCGALSWATDAEPAWAGYCHCDSCRRNCAAPVTAFFGVPTDKLSWTGPRGLFRRGDVTRSFCPTCGTPMSYESLREGPETHLYIAHLDQPDAVRPRFHVHHAEALDWLRIDDDLPRYPRGSGSSG